MDNHHEGFSSLSPNLARENYTEGQAQNSAGSVDGESFTLVNQNQNTGNLSRIAITAHRTFSPLICMVYVLSFSKWL